MLANFGPLRMGWVETRRQAACPASAAGMKGAVHRLAKPLEHGWIQTEKHMTALRPGLEQPGPAQLVNVARTGRLRQRQRLHQLHARHLPAAGRRKMPQDADPRRMAQRTREHRQLNRPGIKHFKFRNRHGLHISNMRFVGKRNFRQTVRRSGNPQGCGRDDRGRMASGACGMGRWSASFGRFMVPARARCANRMTGNRNGAAAGPCPHTGRMERCGSRLQPWHATPAASPPETRERPASVAAWIPKPDANAGRANSCTNGKALPGDRAGQGLNPCGPARE